MDLKNSEFTLDELKILAENGQKDLQYAVGYYYENGINTAVDFKQAVEWYEKAAQKKSCGSTDAPWNILRTGKRRRKKWKESPGVYSKSG